MQIEKISDADIKNVWPDLKVYDIGDLLNGDASGHWPDIKTGTSSSSGSD